MHPADFVRHSMQPPGLIAGLPTRKATADGREADSTLMHVDLSSLKASSQLCSGRSRVVSAVRRGVEEWYARACSAYVLGMRRTIRAGRDVIVGARLDFKLVKECSLSAAHSPAPAAPDTLTCEIPRNPAIGSTADGLDMNGLWVHSHGRVTLAGSLRRFWRYAGRCGFQGRFGAIRRVE